MEYHKPQRVRKQREDNGRERGKGNETFTAKWVVHWSMA